MMKYLLLIILLSPSFSFAQSILIQGSYLENDLRLKERPFLGQEDAPISAVIFEDFACPHCRAFNQNIFPDFKENYIDTGKVKLYFLHFPIPVSPSSELAALAAECVKEQQEEAFWQYKSLLYKAKLLYTPTRAEQQLNALKFWRLASQLEGLAQKPFLTCFQEERYLADISFDRQLGIEAGINGTPAMLIDTEAILNPNDYDLLYQSIDALLD